MGGRLHKNRLGKIKRKQFNRRSKFKFKFMSSHYFTSSSAWFVVHGSLPRNMLRSFAQTLKIINYTNRFKLREEMELYKNLIETEYGVKLCVKDIKDVDFTSMEILVPNKLFADDKSREKLADALQKIAMFVLSMEDPDLST